MRTSWFGVVVASSLLGVFLHKSIGLSQEITFRQNVCLVEVYATVFDQRGVPVAGFAPRDERLFSMPSASWPLNLESRPGKKAIVVLTDGNDNASVSNLESAAMRARRAGVPIFSIAEGHALQESALLKLLNETSTSIGG